MFRKFLTVLVTILMAALVIIHLTGCQIDVSGAVGTKMFYPDKIGGKDKDIGDPRRPMYEGSGFYERHAAGSQSDVKKGEHFRGMKGGEQQ